MNSKLFECHRGIVSFTADVWTSCQCLGYFAIVVYFIDDNWILQKCLTSFKLLEHPSGVLIWQRSF